jgi:hypothetical protein
MAVQHCHELVPARKILAVLVGALFGNLLIEHAARQCFENLVETAYSEEGKSKVLGFALSRE